MTPTSFSACPGIRLTTPLLAQFGERRLEQGVRVHRPVLRQVVNEPHLIGRSGPPA
jgi:hypothetical protein